MITKPEVKGQREERKHPQGHVLRRKRHPHQAVLDEPRGIEIETVPELSNGPRAPRPCMRSPRLSRKEEEAQARPLEPHSRGRLNQSRRREVRHVRLGWHHSSQRTLENRSPDGHLNQRKCCPHLREIGLSTGTE